MVCEYDVGMTTRTKTPNPRTELVALAKDWNRSYGNKSTGSLLIADVDGTAWYGTSYWVAETDHRVTETFAHYNLTPDVGTYDVNGTITKTETDAPRVSALIPAASLIDPEELTPVGIAGEGGHKVDALARIDGTLCRLWTVGEVTVAVNDRYAAWLSPVATSWHLSLTGDGERKPMGAIVGMRDGRPVALLMPVRIKGY